MKLIDHLEIIEGTLYAAIYDEPKYMGINEFRRLLNQWRDKKFLNEYFERNQSKLQTPFWNELINGSKINPVQITQAVDRTIQDADQFGRLMIDLAEGKIKGENLDDIFHPLHKEIKHNRFDEEFKAYGIHRKSWLRFYAIKIGDNEYFLSGGGIKLTLEMKDSEGLETEIKKLEKAFRYLNTP